MTREQAKQLWPVVRAFGEGESLQVRVLGSLHTHKGIEEVPGPWEDYRPGECSSNPDFTCPNWEWRVKPKPREFWVVVDSSGGPYNAYTDPSLTDPLYKLGNHTVIHCIEAP